MSAEDPTALRQRLAAEVGEDGLRDLLAIAVEDYRDKLAQIDSAAQRDDRAALGELAHSLKGSASSLCLDELSATAATAVQAIRQGGSAQSCDELRNELQQALHTLEQMG